MTVDHDGASVIVPDPSAADGAPDPTDPGGWGARFVAALDLSVGKLKASQDATTDELRKLRREARQMPAMVKLSSVFTLNTAAGQQICQQGGSGAGVLIGGPEIGRQWSIRQWLVGGTTLTATPGGTAWLLVSAAPPNEQSITSAVDFTKLALPQSIFYSGDSFYVQPNENVYMVVTGGTNAAQYVCTITYQESAFVPRSTEITV